MTVRLRFPGEGDVTVARLLADVGPEAARRIGTVGDPRVIDGLVALGRRLGGAGVTRRYPQLAALAFFLRRSNLTRALAGGQPPADTLRLPRGLVFHIAPANVDTLFAYSWALSALAGNLNVVRVSPRTGGAADVVMELLNRTVADGHPALATNQRIVTYERDDTVTAALSAACQLRVMWGGDAAVDALRRFPLSPTARDLAFADRSSFAVLSAAAWLSADPGRRRSLAEDLCRDVYWFDQAACASPRAVYWVGTREEVRAAREQIEAEIDVAASGRAADCAMAMGNLVSAYSLAVDGLADRVRLPGTAATHVDLAEDTEPPRRWLGAGMFLWGRVDSLTALAPRLSRRDQTVAHFGFDAAELTAFAAACAGRGVDRVVPVGQALAFEPVWDGYQLIREYTRLVTVHTGSGAG